MKRLTIFLLLTLLVSATFPVGATSAETVCVVLAIDDSGSMTRTDPNFLRNTGAKMLVSVLDAGDQVGIVRFGTTAERVTPTMMPLLTPADKQHLLAQLLNQEPKGFTDMRAGLQEALALLESGSCENSALVLLSDGRPELPDELPSDYAATTVAAVRAADVPLFGIALTSEAESDLLFQLGSVHPDGRIIPAADASALMSAYLSVVARLKDRTVVAAAPQLALTTVTLPIAAEIAPYVNRATFVVIDPAGTVDATLLAPGGAVAGAELIQFEQVEPTFATFTVDAPAPGDWQMRLEGDGSAQMHLILHSRLRIVSDMAAYYPLGQPLLVTARLLEEGADGNVTTLIGEGRFSAEITRPDGTREAFDQLVDDGQLGDAVANDGTFSNRYMRADLPGEYTVTFRGFKGVVPAEQSARFTAVPFPTVALESPSGAVDVRGAIEIVARVEGGELDSGMFSAEISDPTGDVIQIPLIESTNTWRASWTPTQNGQHSIRILPQNARFKGVPFTASAERQTDVRLIPTIAPQPEPIAAGSFEQVEVAEGVTFAFDVASSSTTPEPLSVVLAGLPALAIVEQSPTTLPDGNSHVYVTVAGDLPVGSHDGTLVLSSRDGIDMTSREIIVSLTVFTPRLTVLAGALDFGRLRVDHQADVTLVQPLTLTTTSSQAEPVELVWEGDERIGLQETAFSVGVGVSAELPVQLNIAALPVGIYTGTVRLQSRLGVQVAPSTVPVTLEITPQPLCSKICLPVGLASIGLLALGSVFVGLQRNRKRPWGTLMLTRGPAGHSIPSTIPVQSGTFSADSMLIGAAKGSQLQLPDTALTAAIRVTKRTVTEKIGRPPRAMQIEKWVNVLDNRRGSSVKVNNVSITVGQSSSPLKNGDRIQLDAYHFTYRS